MVRRQADNGCCQADEASLRRSYRRHHTGAAAQRGAKRTPRANACLGACAHGVAARLAVVRLR